MCEKGGMGGYGGQSGNRLPQNRSQQKHIFAERSGHLPDTPRNRQAVMELINDPASKVGTDSRGEHLVLEYPGGWKPTLGERSQRRAARRRKERHTA